MAFLTGDSRILELFVDATWTPIGCLTDNGFTEDVETIGTTTRNSDTWKTELVTKQKYSISFTGIETDGINLVLSAKLKDIKRLRALVSWRINADTGSGYITSISESSPAGDLSTFNGEIVGYGSP